MIWGLVAVVTTLCAVVSFVRYVRWERANDRRRVVEMSLAAKLRDGDTDFTDDEAALLAELRGEIAHWSATSGGARGADVPTAADDVFGGDPVLRDVAQRAWRDGAAEAHVVYDDDLLSVEFDAAAPEGFHCEVCPWESGPDETDDADAYDRLTEHVRVTGHRLHNRGRQP